MEVRVLSSALMKLIKELIIKSNHDGRQLHIRDLRQDKTPRSSLDAYDVLEVPRTKKNERPYRTVVLSDDQLVPAGEIALALDYDALETGKKSRLKLLKGVLKRVTYKEAKKMGVISGMQVISMD